MAFSAASFNWLTAADIHERFEKLTFKNDRLENQMRVLNERIVELLCRVQELEAEREAVVPLTVRRGINLTGHLGA